ncbi:transcription factor AP-4-like isoform X1 [Haliotis rubra]|uniref:transcription factor AP-4-like isoform X1 n=1 Tax=Haliotis rubra TaxID=36100 RepID=UPI001EE542DF|nr:transcription factor AP-4-like isoform X1 [Haliotis rubra]
MALYSRSNDRRRIMEEIRLREMDIAAAIGKQRECSPKGHLENEKRVRREIANSNERRRMQSINAGFESLKTLIPHHNGEKLSKAAILQQTSEHISSLETEKTKLLAQNAHLKKILLEVSNERDEYFNESPPPKRKKRDTESSDEGISLGSSIDSSSEESNEDLQREIIELRRQLDRERWLRMMYEERLRSVESQIYPDRIRHIAAHVQASIHIQNEKALKQANVTEVSEDNEKVTIKEEDPKAALESSMSRKNLETIVEAIRHLEGDRILFDERKADEKQPIPNGEESDEKESCMSDQEDTKSDSSGRDSPLRYTQHQLPSAVRSNFSDKYPIATDLLHRPLQAQYYRPGVIVHKS